MAKLPVWRGSPPLPQWRRNNGVLVPAWAEDPCDEDCDCDEEPPVEPPFEVEFCGCDVCGILLTVNGFVDGTTLDHCVVGQHFPGHVTCADTGGFSSPINRTIECVASNLNRTYRPQEFSLLAGNVYSGRSLLGEQKADCNANRGNPGLFVGRILLELYGCPIGGATVLLERVERFHYIWAVEFELECLFCQTPQGQSGKRFAYRAQTLGQQYTIYDIFSGPTAGRYEGWGVEFYQGENPPNGCSIPIADSCRRLTAIGGFLVTGGSECFPDPQCPIVGVGQNDHSSCTSQVTISHSLNLELCPEEPGQAPTVTLTRFPPLTTSNPNATFAWTTTGVVETTEITLDEGLPEPGVSPHDYTGLAVGVHTFKVRVSNQFGFDEEEYTWEVVFEPCVPPGLGFSQAPESITSETSATFSWITQGTVRETRFALDFGAPQVIQGTSLVLHNLSVGQHIVQVTVDSLECGSQTNGHSWRITGTPPQPPTVEITQGPPLTTTSTSATLAWILGGGPPDTVTCQLDGGTPSNCGSPTTYNNLSVGQHTFRVTATNAAGSAFDEHFWEVLPAPPQAPTVTITQAPTSPTSATSATLNWTTTGHVDVTTCQIDGEPVQQCSGPRTYTDLLPGPHTFTVSVFNNFGSDSDSHSWTIVEDIPPPTVQLTLTPPAVSNSGSATFDWVTGGGPVATTTCRLDNGTPQNCSRPANYSNLTDGFHTFEVTVANSAGSDSDSYTWEVRRSICQKLAQLLRVSGTVANVHIEVTLSGVTSTNCTGPDWNRTFLIPGPTPLIFGNGNCGTPVQFADEINQTNGLCNIANLRLLVTFSDPDPLSTNTNALIAVEPIYSLGTGTSRRGGAAEFRVQGAAQVNPVIDQMLLTGQDAIPFLEQGDSVFAGDPEFNFAGATCTVRVIPI